LSAVEPCGILKHEGVAVVFGLQAAPNLPTYTSSTTTAPVKSWCGQEDGGGQAAIGLREGDRQGRRGRRDEWPRRDETWGRRICDAMMDSVTVVCLTGPGAHRALIGTDGFPGGGHDRDHDCRESSHSFMIQNPLEIQRTIPRGVLFARSGDPAPSSFDEPRILSRADINSSGHPTSTCPGSSRPIDGNQKQIASRPGARDIQAGP